MTKDQNVRHGCLVRGDVDGVFEDGRGSFGEHASALAHCFFCMDEAGALRLVERLGEGSLTRSRRAAIWSNLGPAFAEEVAELPARLHCGAEEFLIRLPAFALILAEAEEHFR